jgi:hypothetical protein
MKIGKPGISFIATLLGACASTMAPTVTMDQTLETIRAAEEVGATHVPLAKLHLQLAEEQTTRAKDLIAKNEREAAGYVLLRAEADGELALALARENTARAEAKDASDKLNAAKN